MDFDLLDRYLLDGTPAKSEVIRRLLESPPPNSRAAAFYEGMRLLGPRTPDLSLMALRLVSAGNPADDAAVVALRQVVERARGGDVAARQQYRALIAAPAPADGAH
ncbi:MAG: hypothetical protein WB615_09865 [Candidatus Tumulicola sp.]